MNMNKLLNATGMFAPQLSKDFLAVMFHKPSSSTQGGKKDVPLRKSDRRKLRDRTLETLFTSGATATNSNEWICRAEKLMDDAFVGSGEILSRKLRLDARNVTLFLRTASSSADPPSANNGESAKGQDLMNAFPITWPYRTLQPILLEYEDDDRKLHLVPLLPLLAALPPPPPSPALNSNSQSNTSNEDDKQYKIPCIQIHPAVSKFICRGAHLMKSGIRSFPPPWSLRQSKGLVTISILGNPQILAVGIVEHTLFREYCYKKHEDWITVVNGLVGPETKGVGVDIVTCYGDDLWRSALPVKIPEGGVKSPFGAGFDDGHYGNVGFIEGRAAVPIVSLGEDMASDEEDEESLEDNAQDKVDDGMEQLNLSDQNEETQQSTSDSDANAAPQDNTATEPDHDAILEAAFYTSLLQIIMSKTSLPLPISTYSAKHLMAAVPQSGPRLDMKQTTHKKIGPFLLEMESTGVIKIGASKDKKDKYAFLTGIDKSHPDLLAFKRKWKKEMEKSGEDLTTMTGATKKKLAVVDLFIIPRQISDGMQLPEEQVKAMNAKTEERRGTGYLTKTECRAIVEDYIEAEGLTDPKSKGKILINGPLCDALYRVSKKNKAADQNASYPTSVSRKDLIDKWMSKMEAGHALVEMPGSKILNLSRGEPKPVDIEVEFRQGNKKKFLTRIRGMEEYGIDGELLCNEVSTRFACSGSVETNPVGRAALKKGRVELVFQGHLSEELTALLTGDEKLSTHGGAKGSEFCLPKSVIKVNLRKGVPARKKR